jgi:hypothetical protein
MWTYLRARWGEVTSIWSAAGLGAILAGFLLHKFDGKTALVYGTGAVVAYLMPEKKGLVEAAEQIALSAVKKALPFMLAAGLVGAGVLTACSSASQVAAQLASAVSSPAGQALIQAVANFNPSIAAIIAKINGGLTVAQSDLQMACGAASWANGAYQLFAPALGASASDMTAEKASFAGVEDLCNGTTTDVASAVQTVVKAYIDIVADLSAGGVPVQTPAAAAAAPTQS